MEMAPGKVQFKWLKVPANTAVPGRLSATLSDAELARAARFRTEADRHRFVAGRACLRLVLADWFGIPARAVPITDSKDVGPTLDIASRGPAFSVSHSGEWVLVAIGEEQALGVDVEMVCQPQEVASLFDRALSAGERARLASSRDGCTPHAVTRLWVGKEAILKSLGCGLALDPSHIELIDERNGKLTVRHLPSVIGQKSQLSVTLVAAPPGYVAGVASLRERAQLIARHDQSHTLARPV